MQRVGPKLLVTKRVEPKDGFSVATILRLSVRDGEKQDRNSGG
jgi:hypothetical protein